MTDAPVQPNRGGAPLGNQNAAKHGANKYRRPGLQGSDLPKGCKSIKAQCDDFRDMLEEELARIHAGKVPVFAGLLVVTAWRYDARIRLLQAYLRKEEKLPLAERRSLLSEISDAATARDKLVLRLIGDVGRAAPTADDFWASLDAAPEPALDASGPAATIQPSTETVQRSEAQSEKPERDVTPAPSPSFDPSPFPQPGEPLVGESDL